MELLKNKLSIKTERDDVESSPEKLRYDLLNLIIDIDIILFLIKSSLCKTGSLNLSLLDQVIIELYRTHCVNETDDSDIHNNRII